MNRLDKDIAFMSMALAAGARSTCQRRMVGCVLVDHYDRVIGTGYNGVPRGQPHCIDEPCLAVGMPSGEGLELCRAIHAEQNALSHCQDTLVIKTVYTTSYPCAHCLKMLINTTAQHLYYMHDYPNSIVGTGISCTKIISPVLSEIERLFNAQRQGERSNRLGQDPRLDASIRAAATGEREPSESGY